MNPERGLSTWSMGFNNLVDVLIALHTLGELELETVNEASKACSECWMIAGSWRGLDETRMLVRGVALKLRTVGVGLTDCLSQRVLIDTMCVRSCWMRMGRHIEESGFMRRREMSGTWLSDRTI